MSRIAKNPISIPDQVEVDLSGDQIVVSGKLGKLEMAAHQRVKVTREGERLHFAARDGSTQSRALSGTYRALVQNMVDGTSKGFEKKLVINGVGYRAKLTGQQLNLSLGYSHEVIFDLPELVKATLPNPNEIILSSIDKHQLGQTAGDIRALRPPEPYKGKGIRYFDEVIVRKAGKKK